MCKWLAMALTISTASTAAELNLPPVVEVVQELRRIESAQYRGQVDALRLKYSVAGQEQPTDVMPRIYLAWCSMVSDDAWNQLKAITPIHPEHPWAHYGMGRVYIAWKMRDQAKSELELVLKADPKFFPALVALGDLARQQQDAATATQRYREALAIADDAQAHAGLGLILLDQGKADEAKVELSKAITLWPDQPAALSALVKMLLEAKDPQAVAALSRLADLQPRDRGVLRQVADMHYDAGELAEAQKSYEQLLKLGNPDLVVVKRVADLAHTAKNVEAETRALSSWASLEKDDDEPLVRLGHLKLAAGDDAAAESQFLLAIDRQPKRAETLVQVAKLRAKANVLHEALFRYRQAAALTGPAADAAKAQVSTLEAQFKLPKKNFRGSVDNINWGVSSSLNTFFQERNKGKRLGGELKIRVKVDAKGAVQSVDVVADTVGDPLLTGHAVFALADATWEKRKREPVFEFELGPKKK